MKRSELNEWKSRGLTKKAVKEAEEQADLLNQDILHALSVSDDTRTRYLAGVIYGLRLAFNPQVEEDEDGE